MTGAAQMELLTDKLATAAGLQRYEIANLARPGHRSRHNLLYWRRRPFLALGPGAPRVRTAPGRGPGTRRGWMPMWQRWRGGACLPVAVRPSVRPPPWPSPAILGLRLSGGYRRAARRVCRNWPRAWSGPLPRVSSRGAKTAAG